jgi:hypothetical protein
MRAPVDGGEVGVKGLRSTAPQGSAARAHDLLLLIASDPLGADNYGILLVSALEAIELLHHGVVW